MTRVPHRPDAAVPNRVRLSGHPLLRTLRRLAVVPLAAVGAACTSDMGAAQADAAEGAVAAGGDVAETASPPGELTAISPFTSATYGALAVDRGGVVHAAWLDRDPRAFAQQVHYRASRGGGGAWGSSTPLSVLRESIVPGLPRVATDGAGRVYVVWKELHAGFTSMLAEDRPGGNDYGTLVFRVLENGRWSEPRQVGTERGVIGWFLAPDAQGRLHLVWSEAAQPAVLGTGAADAGSVVHGILDGTGVVGARRVAQAAGAGYWALSGYVDGRGTARWVAVREPASGPAALVHWDGARETALFDYASLRPSVERSAPQLVRDATGREHVLLHFDDGQAPPAVLDIDPARTQQQVEVYRATADGQVLDFQVAAGPTGEIVATVQASGRAGADRIAELLVTSFDGQGWRRAVALTNNAARRTHAGITTSTAQTLGSVRVWNTVHAAAALAPSGELHLLMTALGTDTFLDVRPGGWAAAGSTRMIFHTRVAGSPVAAGGGGTRQGTPVAGTDVNTPASPAQRPAQQQQQQQQAGGADAERLFASYDITESGWLSGTELDACRCRHYDLNRDGEVTRNEFLAGHTMAEYGVGPEADAAPNPEPASPRATRPAPQRAAPAPSAPPAGGSGVAALPTGKYNCYAYGAARPMPWEPGFGGMAEVPRSTANYLMNLTILDGGSYQYLNRGRGSYRYDAQSGAIDWRSGPFAGSGIQAGLRMRDDRRPVIFLALEGSRSFCVGPQQ